MLLLARAALAVIFLTAGAAKLRARGATRGAILDFGLPGPLAGAIAPLLPLAEVAIAVLLLVPRLARVGAVAALLALITFSILIVVNLARGRTPDCRCFGELDSSPIGLRTLARNTALAAVSMVIVVAGPGDAAPPFAAAFTVGALLLLLGSWSRRRSGAQSSAALRRGEPAPRFELPTARGTRVSLEALLDRGRPLLLVFADPGCGPCVAMVPKLTEWESRHGDELSIAVLERSPGDEPFDGLRHVLRQSEGEVAELYEATATPSAVVVGSDGRIASELAGGSAAIEELVVRQISDPLRRRELIKRGALAWAATALVPASAWANAILRPGAPGAPGVRVRCGKGRCHPRFICRRRERRGHVFHTCSCRHGTRDCSGRCVAVSRSPLDCGSCGNHCPRGEVCVQGSCQAGADGGSGGGGGLGQPCSPTDKCTPGTVCSEGAVSNACPPGLRQCACACVDLQSDPNNCGACGQPCPPGQVCDGGRCRHRCTPGKQDCGGACIEVKTDRQNCGRCGNVCRSQAEGGTYINPACCQGRCTDLAVNPNNCGACGQPCKAGCQCQPPGRCTPSASGMVC